ncbi:hypothetical protein NPIL_484471 [Nephila pilipes]|uniref:Uncharacterized protein n=1 Tax=Nephila pilipes TaxID=299642 RepID=A0A8X6UC36_NEPPI|nr:hypothetical protein NPIL_484471 [Nephila pilipes]
MQFRKTRNFKIYNRWTLKGGKHRIRANFDRNGSEEVNRNKQRATEGWKTNGVRSLLPVERAVKPGNSRANVLHSRKEEVQGEGSTLMVKPESLNTDGPIESVDEKREP